MIDQVKDRQEIEDYLLNRSSEEACQEIEQRLLSDEEFYEYFLTIEDDLHEKYLEESFSENEKAAFDNYFLAHPQRQDDLWLTRTLKEKAVEKKTSQAKVKEEKKSSWNLDLRKLFPILAPGFGVLILVIAGFIWWNYQNSDLNKGLIALKDAYQTERPLQSRVTDFEYSPFVQKRGNEEKESADLRIAETFLLQAVKNNPNSDSYHALGKFYLATKKFDKAIENFNNALESDAKNSNLNNNLGVAWLEKGKVDWAEDKGKAAIDFAQSLKYLDQAVSLDKNSLEALFNRAETYEQLRLPEKATEDLQNYLKLDSTSRWADEARERLKLLEEQKAKVSLTENEIIEKFKSAYHNKDPDQAWQMIKLARSRTGNIITDKLIDDFLNQPPRIENVETNENLKMLKFAGDVTKQQVGDFFLADVAQFYSQLKPPQLETLAKARLAVKEGQKHYQDSKIEPGIEKYTEAKKLYKSAGNQTEELFVDIWIGFCKLRIPQNETVTFTNLAQKFEKKHYYSLQAMSLNGLADTQSSFSERSKSLDSIQRSIIVSEKNQDTETSLRNYQGFTTYYLQLGKWQKSLGYAFSVLDSIKDFPIKPNVLWSTYIVVAQNLYSLGFIDSAIDFQIKSLEIAETSGMIRLKSRSLNQLAIFYLLNKDYDKAIKTENKLIELTESIEGQGSKSDIIGLSLITIGDIYRKLGDYQKALEYYQKAQEIYQQINYKTNVYQILRGQALTHIALKNNDLAKKELDEAIEQYESFRKKIYEESNRNSFFDTEQDIYDVAVDFAYSQLNDDLQALNYSEINRARNLLDLLHTDKLSVEQKTVPEILVKSMSSPLDVSKLQGQIQENSQILEFSVLEDKIISWVITKDSVKSIKTEISAVHLKQKIRDYLSLINSNDETKNTEFERLAKELYQILIISNEPFLEINKTLFIIPDKDLHFLPFSSLINPETNKYLIEKYSIGISPSLNILVLNSGKAKKRVLNNEENLLAIGNPSFNKEKHQDLDYLPSAIREVTEISKFYQSHNVLTNNEATKTKVAQAMGNFELIHFASHAITNENTPLLSGLVLADSIDDGVLKSFEIYQQNLPKTKLVVLSACQTGVEQTFQGEGAISLARPFIALGVPIVVASLWKVDSESTAELMINFHRERKEGKLKSLESLRQAQIKMINSKNATFRQPRSWASFVAISSDTSF